MKAEYIIKQQGKDYVLYAGLLDEAHGQGLKRITTELVQVPTDANGMVAICRAEVETERGTFSGIGDASPQNVSRMLVHHIIRMAETRAKARALRDAVNVGVAALEELDDDAADVTAPHQPAGPPQAPAARAATPANGVANGAAGAGRALATAAQLRAIAQLSRQLGLDVDTAGLDQAQAAQEIRSLQDMLQKQRTARS